MTLIRDVMQNNSAILPMLERDAWLKQHEGEFLYRRKLYLERLAKIETSAGSIVDYANGYLHFGFQRDEILEGWWFREWLPGAFEVFIFGDFNSWNRLANPLVKGSNGVWSTFFSDRQYAGRLFHGSKFKLHINGYNGWRDRIPAYARYVVQDETTKDFAAVFRNPEPFDWSGDTFDISQNGNLLIYEAHVGMAQEREGVGTYREFTESVIPRIKRGGYNAIQLMAVAEHPYYGSFGYHVANLYAPSSRFGTPEELKELIKTAHKNGLAVIMDLVHSHYVKNLNEGLNQLDGTDSQYSPAGEAGNHPLWDSKLFDYARDQVEHFLLSNIKYWLDEFHFDGFRFDGVTSMIFYHHGFIEFDNTDIYFDQGVNRDALTYLTLANKLIRSFRPNAVTIAEDVSGMPGLCFAIEDGGAGFDYRLGMSVPDFWIKYLKEVRDEEWNIWTMWDQMTNRLPDVKTVAYSESHDQALVGDKTIAFRLMDSEMYYEMERDRESIIIDRGMALHKMIRLFTITTAGEAWLNFMGNEFGHPEWIDFPRAENNWSYAHARRQWSLADSPFLRYSCLNEFDRAMVALVHESALLSDGYPYNLLMDEANKTIVYAHCDMIFVLNWHHVNAIYNYEIPVREAGKYKIVLNSDSKQFGGAGRIDDEVEHFTSPRECADGHTRHYMKIYNICRNAVVFKRID